MGVNDNSLAGRDCRGGFCEKRLVPADLLQYKTKPLCKNCGTAGEMWKGKRKAWENSFADSNVREGGGGGISGTGTDIFHMQGHGQPRWSRYGAAALDGPHTREARHYLNGGPSLEQRKGVRREEQRRETLTDWPQPPFPLPLCCSWSFRRRRLRGERSWEWRSEVQIWNRIEGSIV